MPQVFISYSRKDLDFVKCLVADLTAAGVEVWYDLSGLEGGSRWGPKIQNAIQHSQFFVLVLSPNSIKSEWVQKEFICANNLKLEILPLLFHTCEPPAWLVNPHFIDVQGSNYANHFWILLRLMGIKELEKANLDEQPVEVASISAAAVSQTQPPLPKPPEVKRTLPAGRKIKIVPAVMFTLLALAVVLAFVIWGMPALAARPAPSPTPTLTATFTAKLTANPTPDPTSTFTPAPTGVPGPTFTASPTNDPTTGRVSGLIGWNNQPLAGVVVKLCTDWLYACSGIEFSGVSNADGEITITGITPGRYQVITKYAGQNDETRMQSTARNQAGTPLAIAVSAGQLTDLGPIAICKVDLVLYAPSINGNSVTFSWKPYPDTSTYGFFIRNTDIGSFFVSATSYSATLPPGDYQWTVVTNGSACSRGIGNFSVP